MTNSSEPTRDLGIKYDDNGHPSWASFPSHKNVQVRGACDLPPHLPGLIIFVHGVNSTGEWYQNAEIEICKGLNNRLKLDDTGFELKENIYDTDGSVGVDGNGNSTISLLPPLIKRNSTPKTLGNSPVIRFYWGYASAQGKEDKYVIPLANMEGKDYHQMKRAGLTSGELAKIAPYFWGGGPFQNGTNNLHSLWGKTGFNENLSGIPGAKVQYANEDQDRLLTNAPPRNYYAHAAKRLSDLLNSIRKKYPKDTVSIISHSQGTMIALAATALADKAPDALFILNSPYAMHNSQLNTFSFPPAECISPSGRSSTLSNIVDKVAKQATHLSSLGYEGLCVGQTGDKKNWRPDVELSSGNDVGSGKIKERDNHGRTYIYFCPHDRVMGSLPLRSVGWQGLPNDENGTPHPLLTKHSGHLFQRMLARSTPCGIAPDPRTAFAHLPDGKPFWDDEGDKYQSSSTTYPNPPKWQTVSINAELVPNPLQASELTHFDETRVGLEHGPDQNDGWGEINPKTGNKNDNTYDNYVDLYPNADVVIGYESSGMVRFPVTKKETFEQKDARLRSYVAQPTDHSTLPGNGKFMSRVVAYDLPVGYCEASWDKSFMAELRRFADWTQGNDNYLKTGVPVSVPEPGIISRETDLEEMIRVKAKEYGY